MSVSVAADLRAARALVVRGWCRNTYARNAKGLTVSPAGPLAVKWCALGACNGIRPDEPGPLHKALHHALPVGVSDIKNFNDGCRTKYAVLALFDRAIATEEAAP